MPDADPIRVLLVEDNPADARLIREMLRESGHAPFRLTHVQRLQQALDHLKGEGFNAVLLDLGLPDSQGLPTFLRAHAEAPNTAIVVLTGLHDEEMAVKAVREGAQDYLVKSLVSGQALYQSIRYAIERHRIEDELRTTQAQLQQVLTSSPVVLYATGISPEGFSPKWVSDNILRVTGWNAQEATTPDWWIEHVHPEDRARVLGELSKHLGEGRLTLEYRFQRKDGSYGWVQDDSRLLPDPAGKPVEGFGAWLDVSERKRAEAALGESEERFRELAENVRDVFFVIDPDTGRALYLSPAYEAVFGYRRDHAYSTRNAWLDALHPEDRTRLLASMTAGFHGAELGGEVFRVVPPEGSIRWIRVRASPVRDASGRTVRLAGIVEDVTELRRAQEQLFGAQKMEAVGRLAGGVAHDFNNLLTAVIGHASFLREDLREGDPLREDVEGILAATERAAALTKQLLAFSRRQTLEPRVVDLNALVTNMDKMLRRLIGEDVELRIVLSAPLGAVKADPGQLEQVIMNLVVNARDAMFQGGKLTIETANAELTDAYARAHEPAPLGPHVMLAISDTGTGMTEEVQARIFEPFFTTKEAGKGTGLGLATVYGIVKQSGGYIWVYSEVGQGTTFKVYLPRVDESPEPIALRPRRSEPGRGTETILLVEDDAMVRALARATLSKRGYQVLDAPNGGEALLLGERYQEPIHLMVTDLVMPGMSGHELMQRLRPLRPDMKVLYVSGYTGQAIGPLQELPAGTAYLEKPFAPDTLARKVREVLDE